MSLVALLRAAHLGPTVAVTTVTALLAVAADLAAPDVAQVTLAVLAGQLVIGWSNDLIDADRDAQVARPDKPLATGAVTLGAVRTALGLAAAAAVVLSAVLGWRAGLLHLGAVVGAGLAYNLGVKATVWSWLPYAVAFGSLPAVVSLAGTPPQAPPVWLPVAGATLGVAAHFLNTLPDLGDDAATGVRGLPHRLGARVSQLLATLLLLVASVAAVLGPDGSPPLWAWAVLALTVGLAATALLGRGKVPFRAALAIAVVDVTLLAVMG
ncbi:UbiA family prenyltransferase [Nocardioides mesophilus]|uniref:UbiA family prenyltransferase n=1 Tax=Nocardioides mesophilus TaxID=433659 RepID=A0A7G9RCY9_9ACTN|nr:UbiA family prenyltransferase [Nocardioides mesophilus]QNN53464.1 UbiA family prenyltransferase [Nocardioides mesophilus]